MKKPTKWRYMIVSYLITFLFVVQILLSLFYYNWLRIDSLTYLGWIIVIIGVIILWKSQKDFNAVKKNIGKKINHILVDQGIYSTNRHPMYLSFILIAIGLIFLAPFWLNLIIGVSRIIMLYYIILEEEKMDIMRLGSVYKEYMEKVPRLNLINGYLKLRK
jgi:protein-S-isoprenylcysteine O-methyltransferase Ste14